MPRLVQANEATASRRRVYFHLVDSVDGISAEIGEAAGQPQISSDGGAWTNTGIGTLTSIGNGRYFADLTQAAVATGGTNIETRYKSANTAECPGDSVQVVAFPLLTAANVTLDLAQVVAPRDVTALTTMNVGDCLAGARAMPAGAMNIASTNQTFKNPDGSTYRVFVLNDAVNPTSRS